MQNGSSPSGPATLILIDIREDAIYARIGGLLAANSALAAITASQVSEADIRSAAVRVGTCECIARFEEKLEIQVATAAIRAAEKRLRGSDHG
jgi:hypothetical protein